jgi:hypothetical protein
VSRLGLAVGVWSWSLPLWDCWSSVRSVIVDILSASSLAISGVLATVRLRPFRRATAGRYRRRWTSRGLSAGAVLVTEAVALRFSGSLETVFRRPLVVVVGSHLVSV